MKLLDAMRERVLVAEGAMGTHLFAKGIAQGACLELLNLTNPILVREVHREYRDAGAEIFKTNTFGANRNRLQLHNTEGNCQEINKAAAEIARSVAGEEAFVLGAVGPAGLAIGGRSREIYTAQIDALASAGVDGIVFETFRNLEELLLAIHASRSVCDLPMIAQISPDRHGNLAGGMVPEHYGPVLAALRRNSRGAVVAIGVNCGETLDSMLETLRRLAAVTDIPLTAQPSAGLPVLQQGRADYPVSPEEFAAVAPRFTSAGARVIGGCCGTTPEHIAALRRVVDKTVLSDADRGSASRA